MRRKTIEGKCKICGKQGALTFEHVPPQAAFNSMKYEQIPPEESIRLLSEEDRFPWDTRGLKKEYKQGGTGGFYLCQPCNNNTGAWYMQEYVEFVKGVHEAITGSDYLNDQIVKLKANGFRPLQIIKAIMTMFCDINYECFRDSELKEFILNQKSNKLNRNKYRVFIYLWAGGYPRRNGLTVMGYDSGEILKVSEISGYPLGMLLYLDAPKEFHPRAVEITSMLDCAYDERAALELPLPVYQCQSPIPQDYRTQNDFYILLKDREMDE